MDGWAHRRSKGRLEGQRVVGDLRQPDAIPYRRRQGDKVQGPTLPASPRSAGEVRRIVYNACLTPGAKQVKSSFENLAGVGAYAASAIGESSTPCPSSRSLRTW